MNTALLLLLSVVPGARFIGRPDLAVKLAAKDCEAVLTEDPHALPWYIWIRDSQDSELIDVYDYVLNTSLSRADYPIRSTKIDGGVAGCLIRIDRRDWLPDVQHQFNFIRIIEEYVDPSFYEKLEGIHEKTIACSPFTHEKKEYRNVTFKFQKVGFSAPVMAMAGTEATKLQEMTGLTVPIVEAERWLVDSLRTLEGGLYYKLQGYDRIVGTKQKRLNQEEWLALFGASEAESERLGGEEYVGMWRSGVLGRKPRRAKFLYGTGVRPSVGPPLIVITQDTFNESLDTKQHPIYSLLDFDYDATEILATRPNGTIAYALFNAAGELQNSAPPNLVADHTIPEPHTNELEPAISCIRCHADTNQWKPMPNQVKTLLSETVNGQRVEVFKDFSNPHLTPEEVEHRLSSLYSGDLTTPLQIARDAHEFATIRMVDFKLEGDGYAAEAANRVSKRFNKYLYPAVDPVEALRTLGIVCTQEEADTLFNKVLPVEDRSLIDPAIATLRLHSIDNTMVVNRTDWNRVFPAAYGTALAHGAIPNDPPNNPPD